MWIDALNVLLTIYVIFAVVCAIMVIFTETYDGLKDAVWSILLIILLSMVWPVAVWYAWKDKDAV